MDDKTQELNRLLLASIGGFIIQWGAFEKHIVTNIRLIESLFGLPLTDIRSIRRFKDRKGHLVALIEAHAKPKDLAKLHEILAKSSLLSDMRHALCHDLVSIKEDGLGVLITTVDDVYAWRWHSKTYTIAQISDALGAIFAINREITDLLDPIFAELDPKHPHDGPTKG